MTLEKLRKLQRYIFMGYIIFMPFVYVSTQLSIPFLSKSWPNYLFLFSMLTLVYEYFKFGFEIPKKIKWYLIIFFCWCVLCLVRGLVCYEYNDTLKVATDISNWLRWLVVTFPRFVNSFSDETIFIKFFYFCNGVKGIILTTLHMPLMLLYILHVYDSDFDTALSDVTKSCWVLAIAMAIHSFFELSYLWFDAEWGKNYLLAVNPWIYETTVSGGWYTSPLTFGDRLRSLCCEPGMLGHVLGILLPVLFLSFVKIKKISGKLVFLFFFAFLTVLVVATRARVTNIVFVLFLLLLLCSIFTVKRKNFTACVASVLLTAVLSLWGLQTSAIMPLRDYASEHLFNLYETDLGVEKEHIGSNNTRWGSTCAGLSIVGKYPIFGVGQGLTTHYVLNNLPYFTRSNPEIKGWQARKLETGQVGAIACIFSILLQIMVETGIFAGILWLLPIIIFAKQFFKNICSHIKDERYVCMLIMLSLSLLVIFPTNMAYGFLPSIPLALLFLYHRQMDQQHVKGLL